MPKLKYLGYFSLALTLGACAQTTVPTTNALQLHTQTNDVEVIMVTNLHPRGNGSLIAAIHQANQQTSAHIIFAPNLSGKITPDSTLRIDSGKKVTIETNNPENLIISGNNERTVFFGDEDSEIILKGLTVAEGKASEIDKKLSAEIREESLNLVAKSTTMSREGKNEFRDYFENYKEFYRASAIDARGTLKLHNCIVTRNVLPGFIVAVSRQAEINDSRLENNRRSTLVQTNTVGFVLKANGPTTINNTHIDGNECGGIHMQSGGDLEINNSIISNNRGSVPGASGFPFTAIMSNRKVELKKTRILNNSGYGIKIFNQPLIISNSTISRNDRSGISSISSQVDLNQSEIAGNNTGINVYGGDLKIKYSNVVANTGDSQDIIFSCGSAFPKPTLTSGGNNNIGSVKSSSPGSWKASDVFGDQALQRAMRFSHLAHEFQYDSRDINFLRKYHRKSKAKHQWVQTRQILTPPDDNN